MREWRYLLAPPDAVTGKLVSSSARGIGGGEGEGAWNLPANPIPLPAGNPDQNSIRFYTNHPYLTCNNYHLSFSIYADANCRLIKIYCIFKGLIFYHPNPSFLPTGIKTASSSTSWSSIWRGAWSTVVASRIVLIRPSVKHWGRRTAVWSGI